MIPKLAILGASGHGKVIADIAELNGYSVVFYDDAFPKIDSIAHWPVIGNTRDLLKSLNEYSLCIAIGDNLIRRKKQSELQEAGGKFPVLVHPSATISRHANLGHGTVVMAGAVINAFAEVDCGVIINTSVVIEHDCKINEFSHISPNATLAGGVTVGKCVWIGAGSVVKQLVNVDDNVVVGAGSVVINNIPKGTTAVGVPAQIKIAK